MEQYTKKEDNKYYLKQLNQKSGDFDWIEINLSSSTEPEYVERGNEKIINRPSYEYYFERSDTEELPMGIEWENLGWYE